MVRIPPPPPLTSPPSPPPPRAQHAPPSSCSTRCYHTTQVGDTLQSVAERYGIGWHTLFLMNNSTLLNPIDVQPGMRVALGHPYRVLPQDSLHSIAVKFGTSWEVLFAINSPLLLDQQRVYTGMLICVAPGLETVNCRS